MQSGSNMRMKHERVRRGWSQARLADLLGTDAGTVSRWERGVTSPSPYFREKLCALFEKDARELGLLEGEDQQTEAADGDGHPAGPTNLAERSERLTRYADVPNSGSRALACAAYALGWFSGLIVALFSRSNWFVLFHSLQSICFFGAAHAIVAVCALMASSVEHDMARMAFYAVGSIAALVAFVTWVLAIAHVARGRHYQVPILGSLCRRLTDKLAAATPHE
jgi:uncharacterized membrane protein/DNA-binding XRE family transcriptional regulator